jgi:hypothetical protein
MQDRRGFLRGRVKMQESLEWGFSRYKKVCRVGRRPFDKEDCNEGDPHAQES